MNQRSFGVKSWMLAGLSTAIVFFGAAGQVQAQKIMNPQISAVAGPDENKRPTGWLVRSDGAAKGIPGDTVLLINRGKGYYLTSGPTSIVWTPKNEASGKFILQGVLFSGRTGATIPDGFGVFLGGRNMQTPNAEYTEFLVKNDGQFGVFQHTGSRRVALVDWKKLSGIALHSGRRDESVRNTFRVVVDDKTVTLVINRTVATSFLRSVFNPDGEFGVRIGTRQQFQIESLGLEKQK
ncbi:MAG: hypothetical protein ABJB74_07770 [Gemmatimonas sp.]